MAVRNLTSFSAKVSMLGRTLPARKIRPRIQEVLSRIAVGIIEKTPKDTGRAKGNWQYSYDGPVTSEVGTPGTKGVKDSWRGPDSQAAALLFVLGIASPYVRVFFANPVPYAEFLEKGTSTQAPNGMLKVTVEEVRSWLVSFR